MTQVLATRRVGGFEVLRLRSPRRRRIAQVLPGLALFGVGLALTVEADLGAGPWTVFAEGAALQTGLSIGTLVILTGAVLLLLFIPIKEPVGLGTVLNIALIGIAVDITLWLIPDLESMLVRVVVLGVSPVVVGLASGLYIGAGLGPGPRDGLMTAMARRGMKVSAARTLIEVTALSVGWLLGGTAGLGTLYVALTVGWWVRIFLAPLDIDSRSMGTTTS